MSDFWNERFAAPGVKYGTEPNAFLKAQAPRWLNGPAQRVLVPGDGEGRNGVWLAGLGHQVLAVDSAGVGLAKAADLAAQRGCAPRYATLQADLADWTPEAGTWDAVVLVYTHLPAAQRTAVHRRLAEGLKPGGLLLLESFHPAQWTTLRGASGGPRDVSMLCTVAQLDADFAGLLTPVLAEEVETALDEGPGHQGRAFVSRWIGQRR